MYTKAQNNTCTLKGKSVQAHSVLVTNTSRGSHTHRHRRSYKHASTDTDIIEGLLGFYFIILAFMTQSKNK